MKPNVLCIAQSAKREQDIPTTAFGLYPFDLDKVPNDAYQFINRKIVDTTDMQSMDAVIAQLFPQILAYIVVKSGNKVLTYARKYSGEARLLGNRSLGFGGHVDMEDYALASMQSGEVATFKEVLKFSAERELFEELEIESIDETQLSFQGLIVDTTNDVGKVHCGLLCIVEVSPENVQSTLETQDLQWLTLNELNADPELYEPWSRIVLGSTQLEQSIVE